MKKKFNKTLTFESHRVGLVSESSSIKASSRRRISVERNTMSAINNVDDGIWREATIYEKQSYHDNHRQPLDTRVPSDYASKPGLTGTFVPIKNDFSILTSASEDESTSDKYRDESHWTRETKEHVKRVRFFVCILALFGLALGLMSRLILNVSIVEMVKKTEIVLVEPGVVVAAAATMLPPPDEPPIDRLAHYTQPPDEATLDPLVYAATAETIDEQTTTTAAATTTTRGIPPAHSLDTSYYLLSGSNSQLSAPENPPPAHLNQDTDGLHFEWTKQDINIVLGSFYMGYAPGILFSGGLAQRYGAKWPLFVCIFGSALINLFTPLIAQTSLGLLIGSRVALGLIQGSLMPCLYELFNRWLTPTESSIFAPLIKVSMPLGSLMGTMMPGILASLQLEWPNLFYIGGFLCLVWSLAWVLLATSLPQDSKLVGVNELNRIMRKKRKPQVVGVMHNRRATITDKSGVRTIAACSKSPRVTTTPWLLIVTNPSVLALTAVKFTYNIGMDFVILQLAVYLREVHLAPIETISAIASGGYCMQMLLIAFVGWLAKIVVLKRALGLSVTKWRKVFQGGSNFLMALTYLMLAYTQPELYETASLLLLVCFFWMLGAGGESMVPYDLSSEYPASIVGFAHSVSISSGIALTAVCDLILGENTDDPARWSLLFYLLAGTLALGGIIFVLIVKAKPFLPGEKVVLVVDRSTQQVSSISQRQRHGPTDETTTENKLNGLF